MAIHVTELHLGKRDGMRSGIAPAPCLDHCVFGVVGEWIAELPFELASTLGTIRDQPVHRIGKPLRRRHEKIPARTEESDALSKDLKKRGMNFVGSTILYAFMQATGLVDDHAPGCFRAKGRRG